jgi:hypothetical protein
MYVQFNKTLNYAFMQSVVDLAGSSSFMDIYTAPRPDFGAPATGATLLATITCGNPIGIAGTLVQGSQTIGAKLTFNSTTGDTYNNASGTAAWARIRTNSNIIICDLDITTANAAELGAIIMNDTAIYQGGTTNIAIGIIDFL